MHNASVESLHIPEDRFETTSSRSMSTADCPRYEPASLERDETAAESSGDGIPELMSVESWPSGLDEPDFTPDEIYQEALMADIAPGPVGCCYSDSNCACLAPSESECCTENVENDGEHNVSCERIDYTDYPNGLNYPPHTPITFGHLFSPLT